jgi:hypothetical protein
MRDLERLTPNVAAALLAAAIGCAGCAGCAGATATSAPGEAAPTVLAAPAAAEKPGARDANLAGGRCRRGPGAPCSCRDRHGAPAERPPPDAEHKRFEIRLAAEGGSARLDSPTLGHFAADEAETCFYIDVIPGTTNDVVFQAREGFKGKGVGPALSIAEYGPKGPWWYDIVDVFCNGPEGKCNREAADDWGKLIKTRSRGRMDPCGSTVITRLGWDTTGGVGDPELGLFRDFKVSFTMEVKRFAPVFAPGSKECVPK